jgi:hypothetical protein
MSRSLIERRLLDVSDRLKRLRAEAAIAAEQLLHLSDAADEARMRALVSETPLADADAREAQRHADVHAKHRDEILRSIAELEREQDGLLDRMAAELDV